MPGCRSARPGADTPRTGRRARAYGVGGAALRAMLVAMVTTAARRVLVVVFAPAAVTSSAMTRVLDVTAERIAQWAEGRETWRWVS